MASPSVHTAVPAPVLRAEGLRKRFGGLTAVDDVSLELAAGEICGLVGPNGAGKSTLFALLAGRTRSDAGRVWIRMSDVTRRGIAGRVHAGVVSTFQTPRTFPGMYVGELLRVSERYGSPRTAGPGESPAELCVVFGLDPAAAVESLSLAQRKELEIARALATKPQVLLLDEVAVGLDAAQRRRVVELVKHVASQSVAVLVVEHSLEFVESLCSRVHVLDLGAVVASGPPTEVFADARVMDIYLGMGVRRAES